MVNAKNLVFAQHLAHRVVDIAVALQIVPQRFFQHHAGAGASEAVGGQLLASRGEERRGGGQVKHIHVGAEGFDALGQLAKSFGLGQIHALVVQERGELFELFLAGALGAFHFNKTRLDEFAVLFVAHVIARYANDAPTFRQSAVAKGLKQRGHEFAPSQIASAAKQNQVKAHGKTCCC
jgi:hypothetical protein